MKTWSHVRKDALQIYSHKENYAYLYCANGEIGTTALVNSLWNTYYDHFKKYVLDTGHTKEDLIKHVVGKKCYDCSSFICTITQSEYPNLSISQDMNSTSLKKHFAVTRTPVEGTASSILWKKGHVALDLGSGMAMDFACEFVDMRLYPIADGNFTLDGELDYIDYTGTSNL